MSFSGDPYRTLGLAPGATLDEIKRAYRRLAKQYHPDSAGPAALRRFLVIQGAYETLLRSRPASGGRSGASGTASTAGSSRATGGGAAARPPWEADPERARSTRDRYTERPGGRGRWERTKEGGPNGAPGTPGNPRASRNERTSDDAGPSTEARAPGGARTSSRPASPRARPGSTSYDGVDPDGRTPPWDGATWYGSASGTYWTVNPKEYADPRKHGPEYQQRGRRDGRAPGGRVGSDAIDGEAGFASPSGGSGSGEGRAAPGEPPDDPRREPPDDTATTWADSRRGAARPGFSRRGPDRTRGSEGSGSSESRAASAGDSYAGGPSSSASRGGDGHFAAAGSAAYAEAAAGSDAATAANAGKAGAGWSPPALTGALLVRHRRVALALLAWPPLGYLVAAFVGELTGCDRFSASCADPGGPVSTLLALSIQAVIVAMLLAIPALARPAAAGTIALVAASIPAAVLLDAFGGARAQGAAAPLLIGLLAIAYGAGVAAAVAWPERLPEPFGRRTMGG